MRQILHISDIHFGPFHQPAVADGVVALVADRRPDLVAISGDLTQRAKPAQFRAARAFVDRIEALGVPALAVPGNHDVPLYRVWERVFAPFGAYRRHFADQLEPSFEDDAMVVLGANTAHAWTLKDGRLSRARLRALDRRLAAVPAAKAMVVMLHHPLVPAPRFDNRRVLAGAVETVEVLTRRGVDLVLAGHLHQAYAVASEAYYPSRRAPTLLLQSGTTTSRRGRGCERGRNTCNWVSIEDRRLQLSHLRWCPGDGRFVEHSRLLHPRPRGAR